MTRRERLQRKAERRLEWADKAKAASHAAFNTAHRIADAIPFGQPILVGHHSERHHRRDIERMDSNMRKACERQDMAENHISKAGNIETTLDRSIFSDDDNAIEALEQRIAEREAERERMKIINKLYKKGDAAGLAALGLDLEAMKVKLAAAGSYWGSAPHLPYELSNLGGRITTDRKRLEYLKQQRERSNKAEASPNGITLEKCQSGYVRVTFAEKPERSILTALREAGFHWGGGSWVGQGDKLPQEVTNLLTAGTPTEDDQHSEPTYENQLWHARKLLAEQGREALENPHAMTGRTCGCGECFCCAAVQVLNEATA
jgi:Domain of unknown function (DUF3560)